MGKTYKDQSDIDDLNVVFEDDLDSELDFDDDMEDFLNQQMAASSNRRHKGDRKRRRNEASDLSRHHQLPGDWQDFDYSSSSQYYDDWR